MKIQEALEFLKSDHEQAVRQWREGLQWMSLLQRNDLSLEDLLDKFDPSEDDEKWLQEYSNPRQKATRLQQFRKRLSFLHASRKEFHEDYDPEVTDVDFMRLLEVPFTDSKYVIECSNEEMRPE